MADDLGDLLNSSKKMIGTAVGRIVSNNGSRHIGFVYEWNTGEFEIPEASGHELVFQFDSDDEEEDRQQPVGRPVRQRQM